MLHIHETTESNLNVPITTAGTRMTGSRPRVDRLASFCSDGKQATFTSARIPHHAHGDAGTACR